MIYYLRNNTIIKQVEWDVATTTAGDYTVDMKITHSQYSHFINQYSQQYRDDPQGYGLKKHLKNEIEDKLTREVPSQGFEAVDRIRIADI